MDFALFSHIPWPEEHTPRGLLADLSEQAVAGEELGFKAVWLAEHHFTRYGLGASSLIIASNIAARTARIRLGTAVLIPPLHHPVRLAEDTATLDVLSDGRLDVGFGRGAAGSEYVNFGVDHGESQARYRETIEMVEALWTTPDCTFEGEYYAARHLNLVPTPLQQPHPPVYVAATRSAESLDFVASTGRQMIIGVVLNTDDALDLLQRFLSQSDRAGNAVTAADVPFFPLLLRGRNRGAGPSGRAGRAELDAGHQHLAAGSLRWAARFINASRITASGAPSFRQPTNTWRNTGRSSARPTSAPQRYRLCTTPECATSAATSLSAGWNRASS